MNHCGHGRVQCSHRNLFDVPAGRGFFAVITGTHNYYYVFILWFSETWCQQLMQKSHQFKERQIMISCQQEVQ